MADLGAFPSDIERVLCVAAHPDDLEYGIACAAARWTAEGTEVVYVLATSGEAGITSMPPLEAGPLREQEERDGAALVGVTKVEFLGHPDGSVANDLTLRHDLARAIRRHRPDVLASINFRDQFGPGSFNHVDHRNVGVALLDAARDAANPWMFPELEAEGLPAWSGVRCAAFGGSPQATHAVAITEAHLASGIASLEAHKVYFDLLGQDFDPRAFLTGLARDGGAALGVDYAIAVEVIDL